LLASRWRSSWAQILGRYRKPSHARSIIEIAITFGPLSALWALALCRKRKVGAANGNRINGARYSNAQWCEMAWADGASDD
jgi:hypothetical protein